MASSSVTLRTKLALKIKTPNVNMDCDIPKGVSLFVVIKDIIKFYILDVDELKSIHKCVGELITKMEEKS